MEPINQESQNSEKYLLECAALLVKFARFQKAREIYSEILRKDLKNTEALKGLGICLYQEKQWDHARKCFSAYVQLSGELDGKVWLNACYLVSGQTEVAQVFFKENLKNELMLNDIPKQLLSIPQDILNSVLVLREKTV